MQIQGLYLLIIHVHGHYIMFMDPIFLLFSAYDGERRKKPLSGPSAFWSRSFQPFPIDWAFFYLTLSCTGSLSDPWQWQVCCPFSQQLKTYFVGKTVWDSGKGHCSPAALGFCTMREYLWDPFYRQYFWWASSGGLRETACEWVWTPQCPEPLGVKDWCSSLRLPFDELTNTFSRCIFYQHVLVATSSVHALPQVREFMCSISLGRDQSLCSLNGLHFTFEEADRNVKAHMSWFFLSCSVLCTEYNCIIKGDLSL